MAEKEFSHRPSMINYYVEKITLNGPVLLVVSQPDAGTL